MKNDRLTVADVRRIHEEKANGYFFSRNTMKFFEDKMKDFKVRYEGDDVYLVRKPKFGRKEIWWKFHPDTGTFSHMLIKESEKNEA